MIVARVHGLSPSAALLSRVRRGAVGGVILFGDNTAGGDGVTKRLVASLQRAARAGDNPPLLVMTDQEGGLVKRLPGGPPDRAPGAMTGRAIARSEGRATGRYLRSLGINMDLAPVADVAHVPGSFLGSRAFGTDAGIVAERACAFADGLRSAGVISTLKHFPGLGRTAVSTDDHVVVITTGRSVLRGDYAPYRACARGSMRVVMVSSAAYPSVTGPGPAVVSRALYERELAAARIATPTISDDLEAPPIARLDGLARRAVNAGLDLLLYAQHEATSDLAYARLRAALDAGRLSKAKVRAAAARILKLKRGIR